MTQQTAIDWLYNRLKSNVYTIDELYEQAKQMHKKEIVNAHLIGLIQGNPLEMEASKQAEQYYKETYGNK